MKKISVIFPVYNGEEYIQESLESILNQTYRNFEVFCIYDNGTEDSSPAILKKMANIDDRIKIVNLKEKRGLVQALNHGISISTGEYIARADSDDICMKNRFEEQVKYFEENYQIDIIGTYIDVIGDVDEFQKKDIKEYFNYKLDILNNERDILDRTIIAHPTVMMKKNIFDKLKGYNESYKEAEDYELWLRAVENGFKIGNVNQELVKYRVYQNSKSAKSTNILTYVQQAKLAYISRIKEINRCCIWGAGNGGKKTLEFFVNSHEAIDVLGFIDSYKKGTFENKRIFEIDEIKMLNVDYIFISSTLGKYEAKEKLNKMGYKEIYDFCYFL